MAKWTPSTIGDLCEVTAGQSPNGSNYNDQGEGLAFYQGKKEFGEKFIGPPTKWTTQITRVARAGDVLMSVRAPVGPINFATGRMCIGRGLAAIRAGEGINRDFLFYGLLAMQDQIKGNEGAVFASINKKQIESLPLSSPPLPEQERIVAVLDEAFAAIATATANTEKNLANAQEVFESRLNMVFVQKGEDWVDKTFKQVSTEFGRGKSRHRPRNAKKLYGGKYPFIQTGDIRNSDHLITEYVQTYSESGLAQSKLWPKGTVCITIAANIAETGVLEFDACIPDSVIGLVADPREADGMFVEYLLQSFKIDLQAKGKGSAQANINMGTFEGLLFPFPDIETQRAIVASLDTLAAETLQLASIYRHKLTLLAELKQSILHKAFSGELTTNTKVADRTLASAI